MSSFRYTLRPVLRSPLGLPHKDKKCRIVYLVDDNDVLSAILTDLLEELRQVRFKHLMKNYQGDTYDTKAVSDYLPPQYKKYADNLDFLKISMASLYEVSNMYEISDIESAPKCYGCLHNRMGQNDHMECSTGCLHDSDTCLICS